jgi:hypothetical protein
MVDKRIQRLKYCFEILDEKYKIDIEDSIDFKEIIDDLDRDDTTQNQRIRSAYLILIKVLKDWKEEDLIEYPQELVSFDELCCAIGNILFKEVKK